MNIYIDGQEITGGGQVAVGNTVGGSLVQRGRGAQVAVGNVTGGDLIQDGADDTEEGE